MTEGEKMVWAAAFQARALEPACAEWICRVPETGAPESLWWLGFDCGHCGDTIPELGALAREGIPWPTGRAGKYWTLADVTEETKQLAKQAAEAKE